MSRGWPISYTDFSGGLNTQNLAYMLEGNQTPDALNVHTTQTGDVEKRNGFVTASGATLTGAPINGKEVHTLFPANTSTKSLIGVATTSTTDTIFKLTTGGVASALKTGLTANTRWWFAQSEASGGSGPIFGLNGVDTPLRWDGEAASMSEWKATTGEVPKEAKFLTYFSQRLWCAKGSRLYYSGITGSTPDPLNWDAENYEDLEPNDGQSITGMGIVGAFLMVFKSRKVYAIYDPATAAHRKVSDSVGCIAPRSIVPTPTGLFFLSEDQGICRTDGNGVAPMSDTVLPTIEAVTATPSAASRAAGALIGRRYYLSVSRGGTRNDHTLEYDLMSGSFWLHDCASNQFALLDPGSAPTVYSADSTTQARVSKAFVSGVFSDNGSAFTGSAYYTTPDYAWGTSGSFRYMRYINPHKIKRIREVRVEAVGTREAFIRADFGEWERMEGETWETVGEGVSGNFGGEAGSFGGEGGGTWEETSEAKIVTHHHTPGLGQKIGFKYLNKDTGPFKLLSQTVHLQVRED